LLTLASYTHVFATQTDRRGSGTRCYSSVAYSLIGLLQPRVEGKKTPNFWKHSHTYFLNSFWCKEIRRI